MTTGVEAIPAYFAAIRARDVDALRALFNEDAELVSAAGTFSVYNGPPVTDTGTA